MESSYAKEAEIFALLVGCHELCRLGGHITILEGDSFSVIQWGLWNTFYPWRMVSDWVEEVHNMADGLAKEGVFHSSICFDGSFPFCFLGIFCKGICCFKAWLFWLSSFLG